MIRFIFAYILGGLTLIPSVLLLAYSVYFVNSRIISPLYSFFHSNYEITNDESKSKLLLNLDHNDESHNSGHLYKVGWLKVSSEDGQTPPDASIGDMVKNYISGLANKKENANTYFSVLKHNTLYLYDSEKQLDCKGVINLSSFDIKMHPPGLQDYELYSKPNLIHLENAGTNYYINCNKCIDKEDWYFCFLRASKLKSLNDEYKHDNTRFDQSAMNHLIKMVYSDEHHFQTQWFNALLGRIFFGVYRTQDIKDALYKKVITKLDKINAKRPPFLGEITVRSADPGHALPRFTQPKLLGLSPTGELSAEVMLQYDGGFRLEIETVLKWKYSDRLKPLTIDLVLDVTLKEIAGKLLLKIKEPPTNRFWYAFSECPKMEWKVEPVVWEKRIGYSVVAKAIETKIQEFIMETLVVPHFDDITFFPTDGVGGIFETASSSATTTTTTTTTTDTTVAATATATATTSTTTSTTPVASSLSDLDSKKRKENRLREDEELLTTAKSLPELFSAVPNNKLKAQASSEQLNSSAPIPISDTHKLQQNTPAEIPIMATNESPFVLSTSPDDSFLSSSPSSSTEDNLFRTITNVLTDDTNIIVTPSTSSSLTCDSLSNTIQLTYSQESNSSSIGSGEYIRESNTENKVKLRKSSSLALLKAKTGASTAVNVSPAMAHKQEIKNNTEPTALSI